MNNRVDKEKLILREMLLSDVQGVHQVETASFQSPWSEESFVQEIERNPHAFYRVMLYDEKIIGFGGMWCVLDEIHITNIAISPAYRGQGLSHILVKDMVQWGKQREMRAMTLEVRVSNAVAISLYEKEGFEKAGIRPGYYTDTGEDALIMWKELDR